MRLGVAPVFGQAHRMAATAEKIRNWLSGALADKGMSVAELAQKSGVNRATIFRALKDDYDFVTSSRTVDKLADALGIPGPDGLAGTTKTEGPAPFTSFVTLPIVMGVAAGAWQAVDEFTDEEPEVFEAAIPVPGCEQLPQWLERVTGDSYNLKVADGSLVHVVDAIAMGYAPKHGDTVVVVRRRAQGAFVERSLKEVVQTPFGVELWPRSHNPKWAEPLNYLAGTKDGEDVEIEIVGKVFRAYQIF